MPGDLHVVADPIFSGRQLVVFAFEERLLEVPAGAPGQDAADLQVFAQDVPHHVLWIDAFGGTFIVGAAGRMDMVVA